MASIDIEPILVKFLQSLPEGPIASREWLKLSVKETSLSAVQWQAEYQNRKNHYNKLSGRPHRNASLPKSAPAPKQALPSEFQLDEWLVAFIRQWPWNTAYNANWVNLSKAHPELTASQWRNRYVEREADLAFIAQIHQIGAEQGARGVKRERAETIPTIVPPPKRVHIELNPPVPPPLPMNGRPILPADPVNPTTLEARSVTTVDSHHLANYLKQRARMSSFLTPKDWQAVASKYPKHTAIEWRDEYYRKPRVYNKRAGCDFILTNDKMPAPEPIVSPERPVTPPKPAAPSQHWIPPKEPRLYASPKKKKETNGQTREASSLPESHRPVATLDLPVEPANGPLVQNGPVNSSDQTITKTKPRAPATKATVPAEPLSKSNHATSRKKHSSWTADDHDVIVSFIKTLKGAVPTWNKWIDLATQHPEHSAPAWQSKYFSHKAHYDSRAKASPDGGLTHDPRIGEVPSNSLAAAAPLNGLEKEKAIHQAGQVGAAQRPSRPNIPSNSLRPDTQIGPQLSTPYMITPAIVSAATKHPQPPLFQPASTPSVLSGPLVPDAHSTKPSSTAAEMRSAPAIANFGLHRNAGSSAQAHPSLPPSTISHYKPNFDHVPNINTAGLRWRTPLTPNTVASWVGETSSTATSKFEPTMKDFSERGETPSPHTEVSAAPLFVSQPSPAPPPSPPPSVQPKMSETKVHPALDSATAPARPLVVITSKTPARDVLWALGWDGSSVASSHASRGDLERELKPAGLSTETEEKSLEAKLKDSAPEMGPPSVDASIPKPDTTTPHSTSSDIEPVAS